MRVNEIFNSIQGEGRFTGTPSVFVRLQGCDVGCPWCDTKHTWDNGVATPLQEMVAKAADSNAVAELDDGALASVVLARRERHVVLTGGEPCANDLANLCAELEAAGRRVQIETSGTYPVRCSDDAWVTVSPKINMPGRRALVTQAVLRADEIKMPIGKQDDVDRLLSMMSLYFPDGSSARTPPVYLQPLSLSKSATRLCMDAAAANGWNVSIQVHKLIGVR